jgi:P-type Ca2+ transporter type 2C
VQSYDDIIAIDHYEIEKLAATFLQFGYRVLAVASGQPKKEIVESLTRSDLHDLTFLGLVAMIDPLRPEAKDAVRGSQNAGVQVAMITGDHPMTALAIAKELELATTSEEIVTGTMLSAAQTPDQVDELVRRGKVFARVEPQQKLEIVKSLIRQHHFVAITGDGANDAPALKAAHVGVAMGKSGTDVARETADLIITDDRFSSLVAGIEEGRVAYANIRRVIYVLISTSTAEIILFVLSIIAGLPPPLTAVQLLWLNLVTDGIQVIALAFEPAEGMELQQAPRSPKEHIFNKIMLERVGISALVMSIATFLVYSDLIQSGVTDFASRNHLLLLMVLFENVMIGNARSETKSTFALSPLRNPFLLFATAGALALHVASMHTPTLASVLGVSPLSFSEWGKYLLITPVALLAIELHKYARWLWNSRTQS